MSRYFVFIMIFFGLSILQAQIKKPSKDLNSEGLISNRLQDTDSTYTSSQTIIDLKGKTKYTDYKIFNKDRDTTYIDTTLTIEKYYKFNFLRKDNFELIPFHNQGQTFNKLAYSFDNFSLYPKIGATAKQFNFYQISDINYFEVPTPSTEITWQTGLTQGQFLDILITLNLTKRHNVSLAYKGLRSLGKYRQSLSSHGNFRFSYQYTTKNNKYSLRTHITAQDLLNEENGGLTPESVTFFEEDNPDFKERGRLETNFQDAHNMLIGNRYFLEHDYTLFTKKDTIRNRTKGELKIGHVFNYSTTHYEYYQDTPNTYFGEAFSTSPITDRNHLETFYNEVSSTLESPWILGRLKIMAANYTYNYSFKDLKYIQGQLIPQGISGNTTSLKAKWDTYYKNIKIKAQAGVNVAGDLNGNFFKATGSFKKDSLFTLHASISNTSKQPNYNFILYQSNYKNYNWYNSGYKNELHRDLNFSFLSEKLLNASISISQIDNYTYFSDMDIDGQIEPNQFNTTINYLKLKVSKKLRYKKFTLDNTLLYQKVTSGESVFKVPEFLSRNSLYYSSYVFRGNPLYLQTGVSVKYFTKYKMNGYNPLLAEFYIQNDTEIGNFPIIDLFINAKVRQTRLYFKFDNFGSLFLDKNYYSAPNYPYRDFVIRFGFVWNFFI